MRIVHVSTWDQTGGAARAAHRLHTTLGRAGHESSMFVHYGSGPDASIVQVAPSSGLMSRARRVLRRERIQRSAARHTSTKPSGYDLFSDDRNELGADVPRQLPPADVINLHWVANFVDYEAFFAAAPQRAPIVWTLHDMNPFTGGCHYHAGCGKYNAGCGACPQLGSSDPNDLSHQIWKRKHRAFERVDKDRLVIVSPSRWMGDTARASALLGRFGHAAIPNAVDVNTYSPRDRNMARDALDVPRDAMVVLFGAHSLTNKRKGFSLLIEALAGLSDLPNLRLLSVGKGAGPVGVPLPHMHLGEFSNDRLMSLAYSAADAFLIPSLEEAFGLVAIEAMACGTPVVGFDVGGIPDIVRPGKTGLLAPAEDVPALGNAIRQLLTDDATRAAMSDNCRRIAVDEYALEIQAHRYAELYEKVLA